MANLVLSHALSVVEGEANVTELGGHDWQRRAPQPRRMKPAAPLSQAEVCHRLRQLVGTHGIERFILFGSFARETQTSDSDVDLIVITSSTVRFLDRYTELLPLLHNALRPHAVEPLIYTAAEYETLRSRRAGVVHTADTEGVMIHV